MARRQLTSAMPSMLRLSLVVRLKSPGCVWLGGGWRRRPRRTGTRDLFCRGDSTDRTPYRLMVSQNDGIKLKRHDRGSETTLAEEAIPIDFDEAGQPIILRLFCSDTHEDGTIQLGWSLDAFPVETITDQQPLDTLETSSVGIVVDGRASFQTVSLLLADETSEGS